VDDLRDVDVVKKPLNVEEENGCNVTALYSSLCIMSKAERRVNGAVVVTRSKLGWGKDVEGMCIRENALGDNLLEKFAAAFEQADQLIGLG